MATQAAARGHCQFPADNAPPRAPAWPSDQRQRRGYARAVLHALARTQHDQPTAKIQRMLRDEPHWL